MMTYTKNPCKWHSHTTYKGYHSHIYSPVFDKLLGIHLFCELFNEMLDLCGIERGSVLSLPVFEMVKNFCLLFSFLNPMVLKIGKSVLKVGKMLFLLYTKETSEVFIPSVAYYSIQYHLFGFFLFKLNSSANSIRLWISFSVGSCFLISSNLILS